MIRGIIIARLFVHLNGEEQGVAYFGVVTILRELNMLVVPLVAVSLPLALAKYISEYNIKDRKKVDELIQTTFMVMIIFAVLGTIVYSLLADWLAYGIYDQPMLSWMIKLNAIFLTVNIMTMFSLEVLRGFKEIKKMAIIQIIVVIVELPTLIVFTYFFNVSGFIVGGAIVLFINFLISMTIVYKLLAKKSLFRNLSFNKDLFKMLIRYSFPIFLTIIMLKPAYLFGITLLDSSHGEVEVGFYRAGMAIYNAALFIPSTLIIPLMPMISEMQSQKKDYQVKMAKLLRVLIFISLPLCIAGALASRTVISIIYGSAYYDAYVITFFLLITGFLAGIVALIETELTGLGKTKQILYISISNVTYFVVLSYILIEPFGSMGYGIAFLVVEFNAILMYFAYTYRTSEIDFKPLIKPLILSAVFISLSMYIFFTLPENMMLIASISIFLIIVLAEYTIINDDDKRLVRETFKSFKNRLKKTDST
jgi:O-antigen/teichoic acid export membrane protein